MFLNIVTPCIRPENLERISRSISETIPRDLYRWIVVFDADEVPDIELPDNGEYYAVKIEGSISGNGQRNYAIDLINGDHVYFNDDDTLVHPELWQTLKDFYQYDFIVFSQAFTNGVLRLRGNRVQVCHIDSHNFIAHRDVIGETRWILGDYCADGHFAEAVFQTCKNGLMIDKVLSIYNALRG
jgi:hypothetical protein